MSPWTANEPYSFKAIAEAQKCIICYSVGLCYNSFATIGAKYELFTAYYFAIVVAFHKQDKCPAKHWPVSYNSKTVQILCAGLTLASCQVPTKLHSHSSAQQDQGENKLETSQIEIKAILWGAGGKGKGCTWKRIKK